MKAERERLLEGYLDGELSPGEAEQLNGWLRSDAAARRAFGELMNLDAALAATAAGWICQVEEERKVVAFPQWRQWLAMAAAVCLLAGGAWWWAAERAFATVIKGAGVEELALGTKLRGELRVLKVGAVEVVTRRGARVVIEAPAEFRFESPQRLRLTRGRVAAEVPPPAKGFTVVTPSGDAVDLGTRFGVDVPVAGPAEIHVFQGEVIAKATGSTTRRSVKGGDAVTMDRGASSSRELRSSAFIQPDEIPALTAALASGQRARSAAALEKLRRDPALIALLDFEDAAAAPHDGVYGVVQGRWPGSRAVEFVRSGDHLKLNVGSEREWPRLTLAAWVRLDRLGAPYQSLLHTDGWSGNNPGQVHWMVTRRTTMRLALFGNTLAPESAAPEGYPDSRTPVLAAQGRWVHLAAVYDAEARTVRFYLDGRFDSESRQAIAHPARLGPAQIGNWDRQDRKLSGRIDELAVVGRAMSDEEIRELFEAGNPYR